MNRTVVTTALAAVLALAALAALAFGIRINGNTDVYSVRPDGQDLRRLTTDPGFDACAAYSADGNRIAYCSGQGGGPVQVWTMKQNGTDKHQVTHMSGAAIFPDFSPDGSEIVFAAQPAGATARNIYVVPSEGGTPQQLTSVGNNVYPAFSPDGSKIVFNSNRTGTSQVYVMNADGSGQTRPGVRLEPGRLQDRLPRRHARHLRRRQPELGRHLGDERRRLQPAPDHPQRDRLRHRLVTRRYPHRHHGHADPHRLHAQRRRRQRRAGSPSGRAPVRTRLAAARHRRRGRSGRRRGLGERISFTPNPGLTTNYEGMPCRVGGAFPSLSTRRISSSGTVIQESGPDKRTLGVLRPALPLNHLPTARRAAQASAGCGVVRVANATDRRGTPAVAFATY